MNKLSSTAKKLDTFFKVLQTCLNIAAVAVLVGLGIIGAGFLFHLDPGMIGTGYQNIDVGILSLEIAESYAPDKNLVLILLAVEMAIAFVSILIARCCNSCIRDILKPMISGEPFHSSVSESLKKLARYGLVLCVVLNLANIAVTAMYSFGFDLPGLLINDKVSSITIHSTFDLTFLLVAAALYLLSYIFRYGEQLQQLSDETL